MERISSLVDLILQPGTKMAPSYANIFMADLEEKLLSGYDVS